jgi:hypothetical protein
MPWLDHGIHSVTVESARAAVHCRIKSGNDEIERFGETTNEKIWQS